MEEKIQSVFSMGEKNEAFGRYFIGQSYLNMLTTQGVSIGNVTFEPGCRNNWHIHHKGGQILLVTAGRGYYQEWGREARELEPGDVVQIPPEVSRPRSSIGTARRRIVGLPIWRWKYRRRGPAMSGWSRFRSRSTAS